MPTRYEDRYGRGSQRRDRDRAEDRGYMDRASDEVRSWLGDDDAERRRDMDEQRDRAREGRYSNEGDSPGSWPRWDYRHTQWDRQHGPDQPRPSDFRGRTSASSDWDRDRTATGGSDWSRREEWSTRPASLGRANRPAWSAEEHRSSSAGRMSGGESRHWGRGPKGYQRSDARIQEEICDRLTYSDVDAEHLEVTVNGGEVTLSGSVRDRWDKRRAEDIAEDIAGVRDVHNSIRIERSDRGIGQSEKSASEQPGTVLGVNPTADSNTGSTRRRS